MKLSMLVKTSFLTSFFSTFFAVLFFSYGKESVLLFIIAMITTLTFIVGAILEVNNSIKIHRHEKNLWTIGLLFASGVVGIIYMLFGRKRVVENE
jgi:hypothetical protein